MQHIFHIEPMEYHIATLLNHLDNLIGLETKTTDLKLGTISEITAIFDKGKQKSPIYLMPL